MGHPHIICLSSSGCSEHTAAKGTGVPGLAILISASPLVLLFEFYDCKGTYSWERKKKCPPLDKRLLVPLRLTVAKNLESHVSQLGV